MIGENKAAEILFTKAQKQDISDHLESNASQ